MRYVRRVESRKQWSNYHHKYPHQRRTRKVKNISIRKESRFRAGVPRNDRNKAVLPEYCRDHSHHESDDDDREPTGESHTSDELIREIDNEEGYSESEESEGEPPDRECDESEDTSDDEIHQSEDKSKHEQGSRPCCECHSF